MDQRRIDPKHSGIRIFLRIVGPALLIVGVLCVVHGFRGVFGAAEGFGEGFVSPGMGGGEGFGRGFGKAGWIFAGFPMVFLGLVMTIWGFAGAAARYAAGEIAPVGKDTFNYLADGTEDGVKTVAGAIGAGLAEGLGSQPDREAARIVRCHKCNADNDADAKFCSQCGAALSKTRPCPDCAELNDPDAKFCDNCGRELA